MIYKFINTYNYQKICSNPNRLYPNNAVIDVRIEPAITWLTVCLFNLTLAQPTSGINNNKNSSHLPKKT